MWDFIHNHKKFIQILLAIMFLPFAFFGIDSYFRDSDIGNNVASVGGQPITQLEFDRALRERQESVTRMVGGKIDPTMLDSPELRFGVLDGIIQQRLLVSQAVRNGLAVSDQQLHQLIAEQPVFHENGKFSNERYEQLLKREGMTPVIFENGLRRDLMVQRAADAYRGTAIVPKSVAERLTRLYTQQREVSQVVLDASRYAGEVKVDDAGVNQYYQANQSEFQVAEQAKVDYIVLSLDDIAASVQVTPDEARQYFEQNVSRYAQGEERQASHILIGADAQASAEAKQAARVKAEQLYKQALQNPASFADLARKHSQDPGSAAKGGDLGFSARGAMVKPFDDAVFSMKQGEIVGPVESEYGYHVIRLTAVKRGGAYEDARKQVEADLKRQKAGKRYAELAEQFNNLVFEQGESLKPVADALKLPIRTGASAGRNASEVKVLNNPKLLQSLFSDDVVKNKRNTEVVDVGNNTLVAARIVEYKPATVRALDEVRAEVTRKLTQQQAAKLAAERGREILAKLRKGENPALAWSAPKLLSRDNAQGYEGPILGEAFRADADKLPAYAGIANGQGGFVLLRVTRVVEDAQSDREKRGVLVEQLRQMAGQEELAAYVAILRQQADVKIEQERFEKK